MLIERRRFRAIHNVKVSFTYAILGSGVQGLAAAYDLAIHGSAREIRLGDLSLESARGAESRLNALTDKNCFRPLHADVSSPESLAAFLKGVDVCLSCVPYHLHPLAAEAALQAGCSLIDMGGDTEDALRTLARDEAAKAKGISLVTDGGVAPGLINLLAAYLIGQFEQPEEAKLYCGGLPLDPQPPFHYKLAFNVEGLISEYADKAFGVREGQAVEMESLQDLEELDWPGLGKMEASTTSGGTGTAPFLFGESSGAGALPGQSAEAEGARSLNRVSEEVGLGHRKVRSYEYRTLRFPGHWDKMKLFQDLGFWGMDEIEVDGAKVRPRALFEKLVGDYLTDPDYRDQLLLRVEVSGHAKEEPAGGTPSRLRVDLHERFDEAAGLTAMQRLTGFPVSICAIEMAHGRVRAGCTPFELSMPGEKMIEELGRRRIGVALNQE